VRHWAVIPKSARARFDIDSRRARVEFGVRPGLEHSAVIWESRFWKRPLIAMAGRIDAAGKAAKAPTDRRMVQVERDLFIGCYSVRKLIHAPGKLTDACRGCKVKLRCHLAIGKRVSLLNRNDIDELYDLKAGSNEYRDLEFFCGRVIHSFTFLMELQGDGRLRGFYFGSDLDRGKRLFRIATEEVVRVFTLVGADDPVSFSVKRDPATGAETFETR
jgi:hypothetical protein